MNSHEEHMGTLGHRALECSDSGERAVVCKNTTGVPAFDPSPFARSLMLEPALTQ